MQVEAEQKSVQANNNATGMGKTAIGKAALGLSVIAVFSKVFGFAEKLIVAHLFGTGARADVYFAAMGIVLSLVFLVKELIYPSVLPVFAQVLKKSFAASSDLYRKIFFRLLLGLALFAFIAVLFSDAITSILVPGFSEDKKILTSSLLKFLVPAGVFMCLMTFTQSVLNCRKKFYKAAIPEAGFKLVIAAGLIVLVPLLDIYAVAAASLAGSVAAFIVQFGFIPESKAVLAERRYNAKNEYNRILKLAGPLVLGVVFSHISGLVDNMLASTLPTGELSYLGYSKKLIDAILLVGPIALVTVVYSQLSHLNAEGKHEKFKALFIRALRLILFVSIPASIVLIMLREPVVSVMFERGRFSGESTLGTSKALFIYGTGFVTFAVESLVVFCFYALSNTKLPVIIGVFGVIVDIILAVSLVGHFGFEAIALAFVLSKTLKVIILVLILNRKFKFLYDREFINFIIIVALSCIISGFCMNILCSMSCGSSLGQKFIYELAIPATVFAVIFYLFSWLFKVEEVKLICDILLRKKSIKSELTEDIL